MTSYAKVVPETNNQKLQNFISDSPWDEKPVIEQIQLDVTNLIGDKTNGSIHIDESGFKKDGKDSVGVKRQYLGRLGKIENCQMGVFLGYANGNRRTLIDERLYLPEDWANDPIRRKKCGVPDDIVFKTKAQLGLEKPKIEIPEKKGIVGGNPKRQEIISGEPQPIKVNI